MIDNSKQRLEPAVASNSDMAKHNFLARMSHEMRTPLNAILGMGTIAQNSCDPDQINLCLAKINKAAMHLLGIVNDILDVAKIESGKLKLVNSEFNLDMILHGTVDMIKFGIDEKNQELILDFDNALPETVICDGQKLNQVLFNLLSNAIKFTPPEGTITFSVKKLKEEEHALTLGIKVSDTGIGISQDDLKKLFVVFEQLDGTLSRKFGGTGASLALCQNIVNLFGGNIRIDSEPGKGSCFSFEITLEKKTEKEEEACVYFPDLQEAGSGQTKLKDLSLLLAEDVEINREIVQTILEDTGLQIDCAENGAMALELYKANPAKYGMILMDIHMPEMDGLEATRQIRAMEAGSEHIPIIAMTANVFKNDIEDCMEAGMNGHLGKPIDAGELMKQINTFLA